MCLRDADLRGDGQPATFAARCVCFRGGCLHMSAEAVSAELVSGAVWRNP
jgi:hypothetical protein